MTIGRLWEENQNAAATLDGFQLRPLLKQWPVCVVVIVPMFPLCYHQSGAFINVLGFIGSWDMQFRINEMKIVVLKYCLQRGILTYPPAVSSLWPGRVDIEQRSTEILAWVPAELSPAHNIWGRGVRSGIAPWWRNYVRNRKIVRTNQNVRAGFTVFYSC